MGTSATPTDRRLDDFCENINRRLDAMQSDIRQIRNWLSAGVIAVVATLIATLLNIFIGS